MSQNPSPKPSPAPVKRRMLRYMMVLTVAAFVAGGVASQGESVASVAGAPAVVMGVGHGG
ncbi:hypothetical protein [Streptomyces sp. NPDC002287]